MTENSKSKQTDVLIFPILRNTGKFQDFGLKIILGPKFRCKNVQQVVNLPFISDQLSPGSNMVYFCYRDDLMLHTVHAEPNPDFDTLIIAFAKFVGRPDRKAVDLPTPA